MIEVKELRITGLGNQGDGTVETGGRTCFVAGALPGERVRVRIAGDTAELCEVLEPSQERTSAICPHFASCGGCRTQHMSAALNSEWKRGIVQQAFRQQRLDVQVEAVRSVGLHNRRRAVLAAKNVGGEILLGYREEASHTIVDLSACPVLDTAIVSAFERLRRICGLLLRPGESTRLQLLKADNGIDVAASGLDRRLDAAALEAIAAAALAAGLVRLRLGGEPIMQKEPPRVTVAGIGVEAGADMFLQASSEAEVVLTSLVLEGAANAKRIADLFAGVGTFALALARRARVLALDSDRRALAALEKAARTPGLKPVEARMRDLIREPLSRNELRGFDALVFDPPRAGAKAQAESIAKSDVACVIAVSCNPATMARDVRILVDAGFCLERVVPVDQFLFSPHVETVAVLRRRSHAAAARRRST
ncbi:MAG: hypothetical protein RLZ98_1729 [Pseudomonadota bacterium]